MGAPDVLGQLAAAGIRLRAEGERLLAEPREALTDELRAAIRANKSALLAALAQSADAPGGAGEQDALRHPLHPVPLSGEERAALDRLAKVWDLDDQDVAVMLKQCERGAELADGSWLSPETARAFWLAEAGAIH